MSNSNLDKRLARFCQFLADNGVLHLTSILDNPGSYDLLLVHVESGVHFRVTLRSPSLQRQAASWRLSDTSGYETGPDRALYAWMTEQVLTDGALSDNVVQFPTNHTCH